VLSSASAQPTISGKERKQPTHTSSSLRQQLLIQGDDIAGVISFSALKLIILDHFRIYDDNTPQHANRFTKAANSSKLTELSRIIFVGLSVLFLINVSCPFNPLQSAINFVALL
jgi:hypothetical protein